MGPKSEYKICTFLSGLFKYHIIYALSLAVVFLLH